MSQGAGARCANFWPDVPTSVQPAQRCRACVCLRACSLLTLLPTRGSDQQCAKSCAKSRRPRVLRGREFTFRCQAPCERQVAHHRRPNRGRVCGRELMLRCQAPCARHTRGNSSTSGAEAAAMSAVANSCFGVNQHPRAKSWVLFQCEAPCARHVRGNSSTNGAQTAARCAVANSCFGVKQHARAKLCAKSSRPRTDGPRSRPSSGR